MFRVFLKQCTPQYWKFSVQRLNLISISVFDRSRVFVPADLTYLPASWSLVLSIFEWCYRLWRAMLFSGTSTYMSIVLSKFYFRSSNLQALTFFSLSSWCTKVLKFCTLICYNRTRWPSHHLYSGDCKNSDQAVLTVLLWRSFECLRSPEVLFRMVILYWLHWTEDSITLSVRHNCTANSSPDFFTFIFSVAIL